MGDEYQVKGGVGGRLPGALGPTQLDMRAEWIPLRPPHDLLEALSMRLGSEAPRGRRGHGGDLVKVTLAVLAPLRGALEGEALGALTAKLPQGVARELADADLNLAARVSRPVSAADYLAEVSRLVLHPPRRAALYVRAVFAAARQVLAQEDADAIAARLPPEIAELWRAAR